jgi:TRAP-type C4-dicarboxylate transport system permease small subunit
MLLTIHRALLRLSQLLSYAASAALALMVLLVVLSSAMRYIVHSPFHFTEELVGLLFLATSFFTIPLNAAERRVIRIVILVRLLPARLAWLGEIFDQLILLVFASWFCVLSWHFTSFAWEIEARSEQSDLLLAPWMAMMPACTFLVAVIVVVQLLARMTGRAIEMRAS